jgi:hypothetical protein
MNKKVIKKISIKDVDELYNTFRDKMAQDEDMIEQLNNKLKDALARVGKLEKQNSKLRNVVKVIHSYSKKSIDEEEDDDEEYDEDDDDDDDDDDEEEEEDNIMKSDEEEEIIETKKSVKSVKTVTKIQNSFTKSESTQKRVPKITNVFDKFIS